MERGRELTTAWNNQDQKKKKVNICIKISLERSIIVSFPPVLVNSILDVGWRNHQVGILVSVTREY